MRLIMTLPVLAALTLGAVPVHATTYTAGESRYLHGRPGNAADGFNAASLLNNNFGAVFPQIPQPSFGSGPYLAVGIVNSDALVGEADPFRPFSMSLTDPAGFLETATTISGYPDYYMPGVPSRLGANYNDFTFGPVTTIPSQRPGGLLAADAVALTLNVDFSDDGLLAHPAAVDIWRPHFPEPRRFAGGPEGEPPESRIGSDRRLQTPRSAPTSRCSTDVNLRARRVHPKIALSANSS